MKAKIVLLLILVNIASFGQKELFNGEFLYSKADDTVIFHFDDVNCIEYHINKDYKVTYALTWFSSNEFHLLKKKK
jgi:hypothetical protein